MGADFILAITPMIDKTDEIRIRQVLIDNPSCADNVLDTGGLWDADVGTEDEYLDLAVDRVKEALDYLQSYPRDLQEILVYNKEGQQEWMWVSGGMSGGDSPTEAFDHICVLNEMPDNWWKEV